MHQILIFALFSMGVSSSSNKGWKIIAETIECPRYVEIEVKDGVKNIRAVENGTRYILFIQGNQVYMKDSAVDQFFDSYNRKSDKKYPRFKYLHPSVGSSSKKILKIYTEDEKFITCKMKNDS
jgi:hypothetical protein